MAEEKKMDQAWRPFPMTGFTVVSGWVGDPASAVGEISSMLFAWDAAGASEVDLDAVAPPVKLKKLPRIVLFAL